MKHSVSKRLRITKKGKILSRAMGQGHNLAKKRTAAKKRKKVYRDLDLGNKILTKYHQ